MGENVNYVVLQEAGSAFHASLIAGALKNAGIDARTDGDVAIDEFSMAKHMAGAGVRILVPEDRLAEARELAEAIAARMRAAEDDEAEDAKTPAGADTASSESDYAVLREVGTAFHAGLIVGALRNAGVEAHVEDSTPVYDFARHATGRGVRVFVPSASLAEAEEIVAALSDGSEE